MSATADFVKVDRRRGRRARLTLADFARADGRPVRLADLANVTGFSREKIRLDVVGGYLRALKPIVGAIKAQWIVPYPEALRYLRNLHLLPADITNAQTSQGVVSTSSVSRAPARH